MGNGIEKQFISSQSRQDEVLFTSVNGLLDPPAISVVAAVPKFVPELILALHQTLPGPEGHGLHGFREPRAEVDLPG